MFTFFNANFKAMKALFYISKRDGYLMCRFTENGKRRAVSTKLIPRKWNQKLQFAQGDDRVNELVRQWKDLASASNRIESVLIGIKHTDKSILLTELVQLYIDYKSNLSAGTIQKYKGFARICIDIDINEIDKKFALKLYAHFLTRMNENSAHNRMKQFSFFLNFAVDFDYLQKNPTRGLKFKKPEREIIFLTFEELERIRNKEFVGRLSNIKDVFLFQCYTGMEYSRLLTFRLEKHMSKSDWIYSQRKKTKKAANLPLFPEAREILEKYDYKLPIKSNQKLNEYLKEVQHICGIEKKLHSHLARHTFATTICIGKKISPEVTAKMMGISLVRLMSTYGKVTDLRVELETKAVFKEIDPFQLSL